MATETPELDTREKEAPDAADQPHPSLADTTMTWVQLAGVTAVANLVVLAIAVTAGVEMTADLGGMSFEITWAVVLAASLAWLLFAVFGWGLVAHRTPAFAHLWVPLHWGMALVAIAALVAVANVGLAVALGAMAVIANAVAAHAVPRRLAR